MTISNFIPAAVLLLAVTAAQPATSSVTGTLMIAGKTYKLTHVRALEQKDPFDASKKQIRVVLSDVDVPVKTLRNDDDYMDAINADKVHTIEFVFTTAGDPVTGGIKHDMAEHQFTVGSYKFEKTRFDASGVAGKVSVVSQKTAKWPFNATATFSAPITK
jgi:hypothetical protein